MTTTVLAYIPSPSRGVWHLGPVPVRAYALCIIVGIIAALMIGDRRWAARGGERGVIYDIALWAVPFGLVGGRLYHLMTDWTHYFGPGRPGVAAAVRIWDGGLGIWGAVALGGIGAWIACRRRRIPLPAFGDAIAPGIVLAQAIGRVGNYFNQELYGRDTTLPWGLEIFDRGAGCSAEVQPLDGISTGELCAVVHPTFLYELLWNLLVFVVLIAVDRWFKLGHGRLFALYVAGYCLGRFGIELLRSDPASMPIEGIRVNSLTAMFVLIGAAVYILVAPRGREDPEVLRHTWRTEPPEPEEHADDAIAVAVADEMVPDQTDGEQLEDVAAVSAANEPDGDAEESEEPAAGASTEVAEAEVESDVDEVEEPESEGGAEESAEVAEAEGPDSDGGVTESEEPAGVVSEDESEPEDEVEEPEFEGGAEESAEVA